eukprot:scaffold52565_cov40-Phaeocystis_antarctica.AAC.1
MGGDRGSSGARRAWWATCGSCARSRLECRSPRRDHSSGSRRKSSSSMGRAVRPRRQLQAAGGGMCSRSTAAMSAMPCA